MYTAKRKIQKDKDVEPTEFEKSVAQAFFDMENTNQDLKSELKDLYINSAMQVDVSGNRKAVVIHVPYRLRKAFRKVHVKLVRELEKFSGKAQEKNVYAILENEWKSAPRGIADVVLDPKLDQFGFGMRVWVDSDAAWPKGVCGYSSLWQQETLVHGAKK